MPYALCLQGAHAVAWGAAATLALGECTSRTNTETKALFNKERRVREASARERENDKSACDKRPAEEMQEEVIEEIGFPRRASSRKTSQTEADFFWRRRRRRRIFFPLFFSFFLTKILRMY
jgi:hypothetical protein